MRKLIDDTLKKDGKFDKQAITYFVSFAMTCITGMTLLVNSYVFNLTTNPAGENVLLTFAGLTGALSGTNIWNKKVDRKIKREEESEFTE